MSSGIVVLLGDLTVDRQILDPLVAEFGWLLKEARTIRGLAQANRDHELVAVLFNPQDLSLTCDRALGLILEVAPRALPVLCHRFAEAIDWPQVAEAGAFHSFHLPLNPSEVRQSLGFVWGAKGRPASISTLSCPEPRQASNKQVSTRAVAMVA